MVQDLRLDTGQAESFLVESRSLPKRNVRGRCVGVVNRVHDSLYVTYELPMVQREFLRRLKQGISGRRSRFGPQPEDGDEVYPFTDFHRCLQGSGETLRGKRLQNQRRKSNGVFVSLRKFIY